MHCGGLWSGVGGHDPPGPRCFGLGGRTGQRRREWKIEDAVPGQVFSRARDIEPSSMKHDQCTSCQARSTTGTIRRGT
eukprot:6806044-Pyramimonas_sp.AAC.1